MLLFIFGRFGSYFWLADLFSHWQGQYMIFLCFCVLYFVRCHRWMLVGLFVVFSMLLSLPFFVSSSSNVSEVDLYFLNALYTHTETDRILQQIQDTTPKMISVVELNDDLHDQIVGLGYRSLYHHTNKFESFGFFLDDSLDPDLYDAEVIDRFPYPLGRVRSPYGVIYTIHPFPGMLPIMWQSMREHFSQVHSYLEKESGEVTVV